MRRFNKIQVTKTQVGYYISLGKVNSSGGGHNYQTPPLSLSDLKELKNQIRNLIKSKSL